MTFDPYNVRPGYWSERAEAETCAALAAGASPYHAGSALERVARAQAAEIQVAQLALEGKVPDV